jgi:hypothetical protein
MTFMVFAQTIHLLGGFARTPLQYSNQFRIGAENALVLTALANFRVVGHPYLGIISALPVFG